MVSLKRSAEDAFSEMVRSTASPPAKLQCVGEPSTRTIVIELRGGGQEIGRPYAVWLKRELEVRSETVMVSIQHMLPRAGKSEFRVVEAGFQLYISGSRNPAYQRFDYETAVLEIVLPIFGARVAYSRDQPRWVTTLRPLHGWHGNRIWSLGGPFPIIPPPSP